MNSAVKSAVFWIVLLAIAVLVWNFSAKFQRNETGVTFSEFVAWVDSGQVARVEITGNEITGMTKSNESFRTYSPPQYEGLANKLIESGQIKPVLWRTMAFDQVAEAHQLMH